MLSPSDDPTPLPKYQQVSRLLVRDIMAGRLTDGQRLPPEREMAAEMGIAVGTLRKALAELTGQGHLERVQGSGNYIRAKAEISGIYSFFRLELLDGGGVPSSAVLSVDRMTKPQDLAPFGTDPQAHRIRRLRFLDDVPAALEEIWLDAGWAERLDPPDLNASLYQHYRTRLGLRIVAAEDRTSIGAVPDWAAPPFGLAPGTPCGFVLRRSRDQNGAVAEASRTWFDPARAVYVQRLT